MVKAKNNEGTEEQKQEGDLASPAGWIVWYEVLRNAPDGVSNMAG